MKQKIIGGVLVAALTFTWGVLPVKAYEASDWNTASGTYGTVEEIDENVLNFKGNYNEAAGMFYGPYTKANTQLVSDGIEEKVNVELDLDSMSHGELFDLSVSLDDVDRNYVTEIRATTQKVGDAFKITASFLPTFEVSVTESGVYTYQYEVFVEAGVTYGKFTLLRKNTVIASTDKVNLDVAFSSATPFAEKINSVRSVWFDSINVAEGVNVYNAVPINFTVSIEGETETVEIPMGTTLIQAEVDELIAAINEELEEIGYKFSGFYADEDFETEFDMTQPMNDDTTVFIKVVQLREEDEEVTNPDTSDIGLAGIITAILVAGAGLGYTIKKRRFN